MGITIKYATGQTLWRVLNSKATSFVVGAIIVRANGDVLYGASEYSVTPESECFLSKEELLAYVAGEYFVNPEG